MGSWLALTNGSWQLDSPNQREVWVFAERSTGACELELEIADPAKLVAVCVFGDNLLSLCYEVYLTAGTGGNIAIRKVKHGTPQPAEPGTTQPHGLTTGIPYRIAVRLIGGRIEVRLNGAASAITTFDTGGALVNQTRLGFSSTVNLAKVNSASLFTLVQTFSTTAEVFWAVIGGRFYASQDGTTLTELAASFDPAAPVDGAALRQHVYLTDGLRAFDFDSVLMTVTPFVPSAGTLPGQTTPGTTTSTCVVSYNDRLVWVDEQNIKASRIGVPEDMDTGSDIPGRAFTLTTGLTGEVGQPITSLHVAANNRLIISTRTGCWQLTGDLALGAELTRLSETIGATGREAVCMVREGLTVMHTIDGLAIIRAGGLPASLSSGYLTDVITVNNPHDDYTVHLVYDVEHSGVWVFLTNLDGPSRHIFYDERVGGFSPSRGGFLPQTFPTLFNPTCSCRFKNKVLIGTKDGRILAFSRSRESDNGQAIISRVAYTAIRDSSLNADSMLHTLQLIRGRESDDIAIRVYGGSTAAEAFDPATRYQLWTGTMTRQRQLFLVEQSAPVVVVEVGNATNNRSWSMEAASAEVALMPMSHQPRLPALEPAACCTPEVPVTPPGVTPPDGGPGAGTDPKGSCQNCGDWMDQNYTELIDANNDSVQEKAYALVEFGDMNYGDAQAQLAANRYAIDQSNICGITPGGNWKIVVLWFGGGSPLPPTVWGINDFLALDPDSLAPAGVPYTSYKVQIYFTCEAHSGAY